MIKILLPLSTYSSPSKTAFVCCPAASVPAPGSVKPNAPSFSPFASGTKYFCFCSSVPNFLIGSAQREVCAETITPVVPHTRDNSSTHIAYVKVSQPCPPYSLPTGIPINPNLFILATVPLGNSSVSSTSCARGFTSVSAKSLNRVLAISCSLLKEKSMLLIPPILLFRHFYYLF